MAELTVEVNALKEILASCDLSQAVQVTLNKIIHQRKMLAGNNLKRSAFDYIKERGDFNPEFFISEFKLIQEKSSKLPSNVRSFIQMVVDVSLYEVLTKEKKDESN